MNNAMKVLALLGVIAVGAFGMVQCAHAQDENGIKVGSVIALPFVCETQELVEVQIDSIYAGNGNTEKANEMLGEAVEAGKCIPAGGEPGKVKEFGKERKPLAIGNHSITIRAMGVVSPEGDSPELWTGGVVAAEDRT